MRNQGLMMTDVAQALSSALLYILSGTAMSMCMLLSMLAGAIYGTIILVASAGEMHAVLCSGTSGASLWQCRNACQLRSLTICCRRPGWGDHRAAGMQPFCHGLRRMLCRHKRSSG